MGRLTEKDDLDNWCLKGVRWEQLRAGHMITLDVAEKLYGALCKLKDYEDTDCNPEDVETLIEFGNDSIRIIASYVKKCRWIPVSEMLPEKNEWVKVTVKRHRWISDFDSEYVPNEEKEEHSERRYCTLGKLKKDNTWVYLDLESDDETPWISAANDCSQEDLSYPMTEVLAWMPLPEPYREKVVVQSVTNADWQDHYMDRFEKVE